MGWGGAFVGRGGALLSGGGGLLGSCSCWQVARLHQTGPGEVPMTCFTPTLLLCRKNQKEVESQLEYLFEAAWKKSPCGKTM